MLRPWLELARVSNLPTVWTNVIAAWLLAGGKWEWRPLAWLISGGSLVYTAGMFLNDAADAQWDREHRPERPIPSGRISVAQAWAAGFAFLAAGFAMFAWGAEACIWLTGALVAAILAYDFYHKQWAGSVFIMGSCRTLLYLAAGSAVTGGLSWSGNQELCVKAIALGAYIVGLSLMARSGPNLYPTFLLFVPNLVALHYSGSMETSASAIRTLLFSIPILASFGLWLAVLGLMARKTPASAGRAVGLLLAGIVLVDALATMTASLTVAVIFCALTPLLLLWQRRIAAT